MSRDINCFIYIDQNIKDGICLINKELANEIGLNEEIERIHLCELDVIHHQRLSYIINLRISDEISNQYDNGNHHFLILHSGFEGINRKKGVIRRLKLKEDHDNKTFVNSINIIFSGPFDTSLHTHTSLFLLNYNLIIQSLKRQFYMYLKLISRDICINKIKLNELLQKKRLTFIINERFYFFHVTLQEVIISSEFVSDTNLKKIELDINYILNVTLIPTIKNLSNNNYLIERREKIVNKYLVSEFDEIANILNLESENISSTLYLDITYLLKKYINETNISLTILNNIKEKIIEKIQILLSRIDELNEWYENTIIYIVIFFYNYFHTFSYISSKSIQDELTMKLFNYKCSIKIVFIEYDNFNSNSFLNNPETKKNQDEYLNIKFSKLLIKISDLVNSCNSWNIEIEKNHQTCYTDNINFNEYKETKQKQKLIKYYELKDSLNHYVSKIMLEKNLDNFLKLLYYYMIIIKSNQYPINNQYFFLRIIYWIIKLCFNITNKKKIFQIFQIILSYSLIDLKTYKLLENESINMSFEERITIKDEKYNNEDVDSVIEIVDQQLFLHKLFDDEIEKLNRVMNQVFTPRILICNKNKNSSELSLIKQNLINFIKQNYINYNLVHHHLLNLVSPYVGQSEYNIRQLFNTNIPTILILEGIDIISSNSVTKISNHKQATIIINNQFEKIKISDYHRSNSDIASKIRFRTRYHKLKLNSMFNKDLKNYQISDYKEYEDNNNRTLLTTLLLCLDNIEKRNQNVIVIAFSNEEISKLDESITRAGRFDVHIRI